MKPTFCERYPSTMTFALHACLYFGVIVLVFLFQISLNSYSLQVLNNILIFIILAVSYNLINGVTGQLSLEPNGFVAIGAYVAALTLLDANAKMDMYELNDPHPWIMIIHLELLPAIFLGGLVAAFLALLLSLPVFRVRGDYLAIVTLGFGFIIKIIAINNPNWTNGAIGLNEIPNNADSITQALGNALLSLSHLASLPQGLQEFFALVHQKCFGTTSHITILFWSAIIALASILLILQIIQSKYGRAMKAIRDDEDAAIAMGINTFQIKTLAFVTSAFLEGIGGGLMAAWLTTISPNLFGFELTFALLIIIVLGGLGSTSGAIIGTVLVIGGGEWLRFLDQPLVFFGKELGSYPGLRLVFFSIILLVIMLFAREGIMGKKEIWELPFFQKFFSKKV